MGLNAKLLGTSAGFTTSSRRCKCCAKCAQGSRWAFQAVGDQRCLDNVITAPWVLCQVRACMNHGPHANMAVPATSL